MKIEEIGKQLETTDRIEYEGKCHDCGKGVKVRIFRDDKEAIVIEGGAVYNPLRQIFLKCDNCFQKDSVLRNWQKCEVYSRAIGYLRPVSQWNVGKQEEWKMRKNFIFGNKE
jgi:hypothetical protein